MNPPTMDARAAEFLIQPLAMPGGGSVSPEAGFCDGCSGCSVVSGPGHRIRDAGVDIVEDGDAEFLVQAVAMPTGLATSEAWCGGCAGCSAACRSIAT